MVCQQGAQSSPSPTLCQSQERNLRRLVVHLGPYTTCNFQSSNHRGSRCSTQHDSRKLSRLVLPQTLLRTGRARQTARKVQLQSELSDSAFGSVWRRNAAFASFLQPLIAWARPLTPGKSRNRKLAIFENSADRGRRELLAHPVRLSEVTTACPVAPTNDSQIEVRGVG